MRMASLELAERALKRALKPHTWADKCVRRSGLICAIWCVIWHLQMAWLKLVERVLKLALPHTYAWLAIFYALFHLCVRSHESIVYGNNKSPVCSCDCSMRALHCYESCLLL